MDKSNISVDLKLNAETLRKLLDAVDTALKYWPGGDPQEQVDLLQMRNDLYVVLMSALIENGLI